MLLKQYCNVVVCGDGGVGKTSLVRSIIEGQPQLNSEPTRGYQFYLSEISNANLSCLFNFIDLAGQEISLASNQFLFKENSIYIVVIPSHYIKNGNFYDTNLYHYISTINSYYPTSPILIVLSKIDIKDPVDLKIDSLKERFKNRIYFSNYSCLPQFSHTIEHLKNLLLDIWDQNIEKEPGLGLDLTLPISIIENYKAVGKKIIAKQVFQFDCEQAGIEENFFEKVLYQLEKRNYITLISTNLSFSSFIILDNQWLVDGIYFFINSDKVRQSKGVIPYKNAVSIFKESAYEKWAENIIDLLCSAKFKILIKLDDTTLLAPINLQDKWASQEATVKLKYEYCSNFLPNEFFNQLFYLFHRFIVVDKCASKRIFLQFSDSFACIYLNQQESYSRFTISVDISGDDVKDIDSFIRVNLLEAYSQYDNLKVEYYIYCNCLNNGESGHAGEIGRFNYDQLIRRKKAGKPITECVSCLKDLSIDSLLLGKSGVDTAMRIKAKQLFQDGRINDCINLLLNQDEQLFLMSEKNTLLIIKYQLHNINNEYYGNMLSFDDYNKVYNKIIHQLLNLIELT